MDRIKCAMPLALLAAIALATAFPAQAQDYDSISGLPRCQEMGREEERQACIERTMDAFIRGAPQTPPAGATPKTGSTGDGAANPPAQARPPDPGHP